MSDKYDAILSLAKGVGGVGGMFGGPFAQAAGQGSEAATAALVSRELERQKKEQEKQAKAKKRGSVGGTLGSIGGSILGNMVLPGVGTALGAGLGNMAGTAGGTLAAGGELDAKELLKGGLEAGVSSYLAPKVIGGIGEAAQAGANAGTGAAAQAAGRVAQGAHRLVKMPNVLGSHMAQWGGQSPLMRSLLGNTGAGLGNFGQAALMRPMVRGAMNQVMPPAQPHMPPMPAQTPYDERLALLNLW